MKVWIARDFSGELYLYYHIKPKREFEYKEYNIPTEDRVRYSRFKFLAVRLQEELFSDLSYRDEPYLITNLYVIKNLLRHGKLED